MRTESCADSLLYFAKYHWYLTALNSKEAERKKILANINSGLISRDTLEEDWSERLDGEISALRNHLHAIEATIESIPETPLLLPCKLFLRLHYVVGMSMTETAEKINVSATTLRRIRDRTADYFEHFPVG